MNWRALIRALPPGLTYSEAARRMGQPYQNARLALKRFRYKAVDGRHYSQNHKRRLNPAEIDWRKSNIQIARELLMTRERVRQVRERVRKPFVESRGRKHSYENRTRDAV